MRKFWGFYKNESYNVGCHGGTVYIYDSNGIELKKFRDFPCAYTAAFMPDSNIIAVKSTAGYIGFYDLETLSLIKKYNLRRGAQDEGFVFSSNGKFFYNIEKPVSSTATQLGIYETGLFVKTHTLFSDDKKMVLKHLEIDKKTGTCYVLGFMRCESSGVFDYGFAAIFNEEKLIIDNIRPVGKEYGYLKAYKDWEIRGFTDKSLEWNYYLNKLEKITPITIKEVFDKS